MSDGANNIISSGFVLIVDDEECISRPLQEILSEKIADVRTALNGKEALDIINNEPNKIMCIVSDIKMPVMNGLELIKQVRELKLNTPFIFFTSYGSEDLLTEAVKYGAFDFINKPGLENIEEVVLSGIQYNFDISENKLINEDYQSEYKELFNKVS